MSYSDFLHTLQTNFVATLAAGANTLFQTDATGLFDAYLDNLPAAERQYHNCSCCRAFVNRFGGVVIIAADGRTTPAMWGDLAQADYGMHNQGVAAMQAIVARARVKGPFMHADVQWGTPEAGGFTHMHVTPPQSARYVRHGKLTARQRMAARREDVGTVSRFLAETDVAVLQQALLVVQSDRITRNERFQEPVKFLLDLKNATAAAEHPVLRANILQRAVAMAPDGFCHPRAGVVGNLLEDIAAGYPFDDLVRRFNAKVGAAVYQRATAAPTAGNVQRAEQLFADLGLAPALSRRYLGVCEAPLEWAPTGHSKPAVETLLATGGVFGGVATKQAAASAMAPLSVPANVMTWAKFRDTILPTATAIEALVPADDSRFAALVTAADPQAPNLLQWSNPTSWYYAAGIDGEFRRRVTEAGGRYDDVDVRATLIWNNRNDLDLHVHTPGGHHIYYADRRDPSGGWLDVDMNIRGETTKPVENVRWSRGDAPAGAYRVAVWNYRHHEVRGTDTPYAVELEVGGQVFRYDGVFTAHDSLQVQRDVVDFTLDGCGKLVGAARPSRYHDTSAAATTGSTSWGLTAGEFVKVVGITRSPNLWGKTPVPVFGSHWFFLLEGCRDDQAGRGRGFFTETVRADLREVRSVLEAYNAAAAVIAVQQPACGLGMSSDKPWNLTLRVTAPGGQRLITVDRHE